MKASLSVVAGVVVLMSCSQPKQSPEKPVSPVVATKMETPRIDAGLERSAVGAASSLADAGMDGGAVDAGVQAATIDAGVESKAQKKESKATLPRKK